MPLPIGDVLGILSDNLVKRSGVLPLSKKQATGWSDGLDIPFGGETVIYTGQMYQLIPSINSMAGRMAKFEDSWITRFFPLGRALNKAFNLSCFMAFSSLSERKQYNTLLRNVARLLQKAGVEFGYLYGQESYSGALLYDEGVDDAFTEHARRVYRTLRETGVKRVITVDPHTTDMFRNVYPTVIKGYELETTSYLELLAKQPPHFTKSLGLDVVVHDSCMYARYEGLVEEPRKLLTEAGARLHEPELTGRLTHCCGGPLESLFPSKSHEIAAKRVGQLAECGNRIVTMCPICLATLRRADENRLQIRDISQYLIESV